MYIELEMYIDLESETITISSGYDTTCTYCNIKNIEEIKQALGDYLNNLINKEEENDNI